MRIHSILTLALIALVPSAGAQTTNSTLSTEKEQVSYALGYSIGMNLKRMEYEVDPDVIARGIRDILDGKPTAMTEAEAQQALRSYQQKLAQKRQQEQAAIAAKNKAAGATWLAENGKKPGVVTLEDGLQYKVLSEGNGKPVEPTDTVKAKYRGTLIDGTEFDHSDSQEFKVNRVIRGWTEALEKMKVGDKWELYIPSDLAYGDRGRPPRIPPGSTLIFDVEVLDVITPQPITSDIIKVPSAEEMKKGAKIETIKASDLKRIEEEAKKAKEAEQKQEPK